MKKQLLTIVMVTMLLVATIISTVDAATISTSALKDGATTVTMEMKEAVQSATITLSYDANVFEVDKTVGKNGVTTDKQPDGLTVNANEAGKVTIVIYGTEAVVSKVNVAFKVKAGATENAGDKEVAGTFEVTRFEDANDTFAQPSVKLVVKEAGTPTTPTQKPTNKPTDKVNPTDKVTPTGKPGSLVQAGAPVYVAGIAVIVVAAFVLMVRKAK